MSWLMRWNQHAIESFNPFAEIKDSLNILISVYVEVPSILIMKQHVFELSYNIEGTTVKVYKFNTRVSEH
jgi:hypothetical protein